MNFHPNTYQLNKEYRQRQENSAKQGREAAAQKQNSAKSNNIARIISQVLISLK